MSESRRPILRDGLAPLDGGGTSNRCSSNAAHAVRTRRMPRFGDPWIASFLVGPSTRSTIISVFSRKS
jgi:hypothetical protein